MSIMFEGRVMPFPLEKLEQQVVEFGSRKVSRGQSSPG
jgi:hypothetical protein